MAQQAVAVGYDLMNGRKPAETTILLKPQLVTRANVKEYKGWSSPR